MYDNLPALKKPRVAVFELASCAGCQLQILNLEDELVDVLRLIEFAYFKEAMSNTSEDYDLALIEGAVHPGERRAEAARDSREGGHRRDPGLLRLSGRNPGPQELG